MAKQTYNIGGVKVRSESPEQAQALAEEVVSSGGRGAIAVDSLTQDGNIKPITPITPVPPTQTPALLSTIGSSADSYVKNLEKTAEERQKQSEGSLSALLKTMGAQQGETTLTNKLYEDTVDPAEAELRDINQQILEEQVALQRTEEELSKNKEGLFGTGLEQRLQEARTDSLRRQADLSIIQLSKQGKYDSAKAIADRAVRAVTEQQQIKLDTLKFIYEENKDLFTTAEQRAFETAQADRERLLNIEQQDLKTISDLSLDALQNGAPASVASAMRAAKTVDQAMRIGGQYVGALDRAYKLAQIQQVGADVLKAEAAAEDKKNGVLTEDEIKKIDNSPQGKQLVTAANLKLKLSSYQDLVKKFGFEVAGADKAVLQNAYTELQLAYKEAANLGVLNGPDLTLVESAIRSATPGLLGNLGNVLTLGQGTRNLESNLEQAQTTLNNSAGLAAEQLYARDPAYKNSLYIQSILLPFSGELIDAETEASMDAALTQ